MAAGNNIPHEQGATAGYNKNTPVQKFAGKHRVPPNKGNEKTAPYPNGLAFGGPQPNNASVIQKAAGKRLFGGKGGSFAANYSRNDK